MQESTRQPLKNWEIIFGMATPTSENAKERHFQPHSSQREALPASLFPKRASPVPLWTHTTSSRWHFAVWTILQPWHNTIFYFRWLIFIFFSPFSSGAFLNIAINLLPWKPPKLLDFLSSPIVCTSDLFTKRPGLHCHKSWHSALLWY